MTPPLIENLSDLLLSVACRLADSELEKPLINPSLESIRFEDA